MAFSDPRALAAGPYRTPDPLSARAAIYAWQRPKVDLVGAAVAVLADLSHRTLVVDVGCGPGRFLGRLRVARPDLRCLGVDVSTGMLRAVEDAQMRRVVGSADACHCDLRRPTPRWRCTCSTTYRTRRPDWLSCAG